MAKGKTQSKSDAVRDEFKNGVTAPKDVVANLRKKGLRVSAALVSQLKTRELTKTKPIARSNGKHAARVPRDLRPKTFKRCSICAAW